MKRIVMLVAAAASFAAGASAQPAPPIEQIPGVGRAPEGREGRGRAGEGHQMHFFISPSGQPFRGGDGLAAWFAQADLDHDGAITAQEFQADALRAFQAFDANGDGVVDGFEIQAYEQQVPEIGQIIVPEAGGRGRGRGDRKSGDHGSPADAAAQEPHAGAEGAARFSLLNEPEPLLAADASVDGRVTRAEWLQATERRFAKLDRDKTGRLTLEELRARPPKK